MAPGKSAPAREPWLWAALTAAGCLLVLLAAGRDWVGAVRGSGEMTVPTGGDLSPVLTPLALAGLAGVVAVLVTKGAGRRIVGSLLALCGLGALAAVWGATAEPGIETWLREHNVLGAAGPLEWDLAVGWPMVAGLGALLVFAGGVLAVVRGGRWAGMSDRYERAADGPRAQTDGDRALWDALDRGDDPTESR
ncbi:Trp biosynthesis-associated membrane protein [Nonomuraea sp. MCN248]|uniref:Trp biosynthesis-associated membrane protein n=1 Tax=Nonomuraea corallina TaxID=2989783 RepID=A0ABT4SGF4_9ACTN|nr:Trp biosynthesis-associated membrane protein [Nonomuraea corallina]MDA0636286.1 Trp biosynthesis-associated membrane protein [Nonomuraea corallina]